MGGHLIPPLQIDIASGSAAALWQWLCAAVLFSARIKSNAGGQAKVGMHIRMSRHLPCCALHSMARTQLWGLRRIQHALTPALYTPRARLPPCCPPLQP